MPGLRAGGGRGRTHRAAARAASRVDRVAREEFQRERQARPAAADAARPLPSSLRAPAAGPRGAHRRARGRKRRRAGRGPHRVPRSFDDARATSAIPTRRAEALHEGWMDSGDLGYVAEGELFVTGRSKDMVIKAGRNLHPQEIEEVSGAVAGCGRAAWRRSACPTRRSEPNDWWWRRRAAGPLPRELAALRAAIVGPRRRRDRHAARRRRHLPARLGAEDFQRQDPARRGARGLSGRPARPRAAIGAHAAARLALGADLGAARSARCGSRRAWHSPATSGCSSRSRCRRCGCRVLVPPGRPVDRAARRWCRMMFALAGCRFASTGRPASKVRSARCSWRTTRAIWTRRAARRACRSTAGSSRSATCSAGRRSAPSSPVAAIPPSSARTVLRASPMPIGSPPCCAAGTSLLVFPEGTFVRDRGLLPFRLGAFKAAVETGAPVVPVAVDGTRRMLPDGARLPAARSDHRLDRPPAGRRGLGLARDGAPARPGPRGDRLANRRSAPRAPAVRVSSIPRRRRGIAPDADRPDPGGRGHGRPSPWGAPPRYQASRVPWRGLTAGYRPSSLVLAPSASRGTARAPLHGAEGYSRRASSRPARRSERWQSCPRVLRFPSSR